jgi:hypothetical protein
VRSTAPELNGGEDAGPSARGAAPKAGEAPGHAHRERGGMRWLGTNGVAENRGEHGSDGLPEVDKGAGADEMQWGGLHL